MLTMTVPSSKRGETHTIRLVAEGIWTCDCPDHVYRAAGKPYVCKHIAKLAVSLASFATKTGAKSKSAENVLEDC